MNPAKDLVKLYHPSGQNPKEVATASEVVMEALYQLGLPAGSFSTVYKNYNYSLPAAIVVVGSDFHRYKYKGTGTVIDPTTDTYDASGVGSHWIDLELVVGCV